MIGARPPRLALLLSRQCGRCGAAVDIEPEKEVWRSMAYGHRQMPPRRCVQCGCMMDTQRTRNYDDGGRRRADGVWVCPPRIAEGAGFGP